MNCDKQKPMNEAQAEYWRRKDAELDRAYMGKQWFIKSELVDFLAWYNEHGSAFDCVSGGDLVDIYINHIKNLHISIA